MSKVITLKKGLDIHLNGVAEKRVVDAEKAVLYAVKPVDFRLIPKLSVKPGDAVKAGDVLFTDKANPAIRFASPVSGTVESVNRGERRKMLEVVVKASPEIEYVDFGQVDVNTLGREEVVERMLESGVWPLLIQRPYGIIADPGVTPKAVFVSAFDSSPLAPDYDFVLKGEEKALQAGVDCLKKLCGKEVNLGVKADTAADSVFLKLENTAVTRFKGPHPAGNTGVQINRLNPINKGEFVWTINIQDLVILGRLFTEGRYDARKIVSLSGSEVSAPAYFHTVSGAQISSLTDGKLKNKVHQRIVSGNVLTGQKVTADNFLGFYANQVTVIPEGDYSEFLGWAMPGFGKFSASKLFPSFLCPKKRYSLNANYHGERRAFVVSGQYEKVFPMDILPVYLLKAALAGDIDKMEQLGIYEVLPEDMALCEFVCTSKTPVQQILGNGIDLMMKETN